MTEDEKDVATLELAKGIADDGNAGEALYAVDKRASRIEQRQAQIETDLAEAKRANRVLKFALVLLAGFVVILGLWIWSKLKPKPAPAPEQPPERKPIGFLAHSAGPPAGTVNEGVTPP